MAKIQELRQLIADGRKEDIDGFDNAFYQGMEIFLDNIGDGGISENWVKGFMWAMGEIGPEGIGGSD